MTEEMREAFDPRLTDKERMELYTLLSQWRRNLEHQAEKVKDLIERERQAAYAEGRRQGLNLLADLMKALEPELTGPPKNVPKSSWAEQWDRADAAIRALIPGKGE